MFSQRYFHHSVVILRKSWVTITYRYFENKKPRKVHDAFSVSYRDRKDDDTLKVMTVSANEFIRRFMLHVLPDGYMRIRHFGFLANRWKKKYLGMCRQLLGIPPLESETCQKTTRDLMLELTGIDVTQCPLCKKGQMIKIGELPKFSGGSFTVSLK